MCQYGQGIVRRLFKEFDGDKLKGFAVWLPMMRNDSVERARGAPKLFHRFIYFDDEEEELAWVQKHFPR